MAIAISPAGRSFAGRIAAAFLAAALHAGPVDARPARPAPPLPPPGGRIVNVSTEPQLQAAIRSLASGTTIVLAPGTYALTSTLSINGRLADIGIRGAAANADAVTLSGPGMTQSAGRAAPFGVWTGGDVQGLTIANLTIRDFPYHAIIFNAGTHRPHIYNVRLADAGQQLLKANPDHEGRGVDNAIVEYSVFEYTATAPSDYTNGIDVHGGANWSIRHNLFRNIVAPRGQLAGPAVLMWRGSYGTIVEGNTFVNCARGIAYGLEGATGFDHSGGIIRNNFFSRAASEPGDVGIAVADSPNTQIVNNTVVLSGTYTAAIEYRYARTTGVTIVNNMTDAPIVARDGAAAAVRSNLTAATPAMFVDARRGDLHLSAAAVGAIDRGETVADVTDDWDGTPRPQGAAYDIGADERQPTAQHDGHRRSTRP